MKATKLSFLGAYHVLLALHFFVMNSEREILIWRRGQKVAIIYNNLIDEVFDRDHFRLPCLLLTFWRLLLLGFLICSYDHIVFITGMGS